MPFVPDLAPFFLRKRNRKNSQPSSEMPAGISFHVLPMNECEDQTSIEDDCPFAEPILRSPAPARARIFEITQLTLGIHTPSLKRILPDSALPHQNDLSSPLPACHSPPFALSIDYFGFHQTTPATSAPLPQSSPHHFQPCMILQWECRGSAKDKNSPWVLTTHPDFNTVMVSIKLVRKRLPNKTLHRIGLNLIRYGNSLGTKTLRAEFTDGFVLITLRELSKLL